MRPRSATTPRGRFRPPYVPGTRESAMVGVLLARRLGRLEGVVATNVLEGERVDEKRCDIDDWNEERNRPPTAASVSWRNGEREPHAKHDRSDVRDQDNDRPPHRGANRCQDDHLRSDGRNEGEHWSRDLTPPTDFVRRDGQHNDEEDESGKEFEF